MSILIDVTRYYLYEVNDIKFHATVTYKKYRNWENKIEYCGTGKIQTLDDTFRCLISYGYGKQLTLQQLNYESKCDFNTFFKENHIKKLATYLLGCFQFMVRMSPESDEIKTYINFNIDLGPEEDGYYRHYNLDNFTFAFYGKNFLEKYFGATGKRSTTYLHYLEEKPDLQNIISSIYFGRGNVDIFYYINLIEPLIGIYSTTKELLASFSSENYKGKDFFKDSLIWLPSYIAYQSVSLCDLSINTRNIWNTQKIIKNVVSSDTPLYDTLVNDKFYHFDKKKSSPNNIVIMNDIVYGDCLGTYSDLFDD